MNVRFAESAKHELLIAAVYYDEQRLGLGDEFVNEANAAKHRIEKNPDTWERCSARLRRCSLHRFPFALLYRLDQHEAIIVSVMDLRRDPTSWELLD